MPVFIPNDYLFSTHMDKSKNGEKWEVYAWATRDLMCKVGGFAKHDLPFKDKIAVYDYYTAQIDQITFTNGQVLQYRPDGDYTKSSEESAGGKKKDD